MPPCFQKHDPFEHGLFPSKQCTYIYVYIYMMICVCMLYVYSTSYVRPQTCNARELIYLYIICNIHIGIIYIHASLYLFLVHYQCNYINTKKQRYTVALLHLPWCMLETSHPLTQVHSSTLSFLLKHPRWLLLAWEVQKVASQPAPLEHAECLSFISKRSHGAFTGHLRAISGNIPCYCRSPIRLRHPR